MGNSSKEYPRNYMRAHPELNTRCYRSWRANHLEEARTKQREYNKAHRIQHNAIALANFHYPVAQPCSIDGCGELGQRHHPDYSKPLEIVWLCRQHHKSLSRLY